MIANAVKNRIAMSDVSVVEPGDGPSPCESCDPRGPSNPRRRPPARRLRLATVMPFSAKPPSVPTSPLSRPRAPPRPVRDAMPSGTRRERRRVRVAGDFHTCDGATVKLEVGVHDRMAGTGCPNHLMQMPVASNQMHMHAQPTPHFAVQAAYPRRTPRLVAHVRHAVTRQGSATLFRNALQSETPRYCCLL